MVVASTAIVMAPVTPVFAAPEGWSDPDPVNPLHALTVYVFAPLGLYLLTILLASVPRFLEGAKSAPKVTDPAPNTRLGALFGDDEAPELEASKDAD